MFFFLLFIKKFLSLLCEEAFLLTHYLKIILEEKKTVSELRLLICYNQIIGKIKKPQKAKI